MSEIKLSNLGPGGQRCSIVVRLLRIWDCIIPPLNTLLGLDFVVVDYEGFAMHGCIPIDIADEFSHQLSEGKVYRIGMIPLDGGMVELISGMQIDSSHKFSYCDAPTATVEQLLYMNPQTIKGSKFKVVGRVVRLQHRAGCLRISLIIEHNGFKLQTIVFGNLAHWLTGVDITMLDFAERMNFMKIPTVAEDIINREYEFILGVLNRSHGPGLTFKIFQFAPTNTSFAPFVVVAQ
ncbi:Fgenesh protein [Corchorus olitorius]|uniref:Fgenesh protein n=1 Tax=Corchorus olitorius TaxID=93759 RepID=A0A1R3KMX0_9ROSI|nr:Fgenesh protein [Corchorus olitorius]